MNRRFTSWAALAALALATMNCAGGTGSPLVTPPDPTVSRTAKVFPEVELLTAEGEVIVGKILRLESADRLVILPIPYWNVATIERPLAAIARISRREKTKSVGTSALIGFGIAAVWVGVKTLPHSKYDTDFGDASLGIPIVAAVTGLPLGALIGVATSGRKEYDLRWMGLERKAAVVARLMGI